MILRYNDGISVTRQFNAGERSLRISLCLSLRFGEPMVDLRKTESFTLKTAPVAN
jgi:hypothetical protein